MEGKFYDTNNHYSHQILTYGTRALHFSLNTIINTGRKEIRPGDVISLGLPHQFKWEDDPYNKSKQAEGIPLDKLLFSTDVVTPSSEAEKVEEIVNAYRETNDEVRNAMNDSMMPVALRTLKENRNVLNDVNNRDNKVRRQKQKEASRDIIDELVIDLNANEKTLSSIIESQKRFDNVKDESKTITEGFTSIGRSNFVTGALLRSSKNDLLGPLETNRGWALIHIKEIASIDSAEYEVQRESLKGSLRTKKQNQHLGGGTWSQ